MVEKWPCEKCGVPIVSTFTYCPSCGQPQTNAAGPAPLINRDVEHLKLLSIFYYVMAGLSAFMGSVPIIHLAIGIAMLTSDGMFPKGQQSGPPPDMIGYIFVGFASIFILGGWTSAVLQFLTARYLKAHRRKGFCTFVGAVTCLNMPIGTILGIFTLIILGRTTVKPLFDAEADRAPDPA